MKDISSKLKLGVVLTILCLIFLGCASTSQPVKPKDKISKEKGAIIFSVVEDETERRYMGVVARAATGLLSAGIYFVKSNNKYVIHFSEFDQKTKKTKGFKIIGGTQFSVSHSVDTRELAKSKKWHVFELNPGTYLIEEIVYYYGNQIRTTRFNYGAMTFTVVPGKTKYIGDFVLGLKESWMKKDYGAEVLQEAPMISGHGWDIDEAENYLSGYENLPQGLLKAKISVNPILR